MMDRAILDGGVNLVALAESSKTLQKPPTTTTRDLSRFIYIDNMGLLRMRCLFFEGVWVILEDELHRVLIEVQEARRL